MKIIKKFEKLIKHSFFKILKILNIYDKEYEIFKREFREEKQFRIIYEKCKAYTMTSIFRMYSLYKSIEYIVKNKIPGDIVEYGVWRGGSMMVCALSLLYFKDINRKIYLYDTYEGHVESTIKDVSYRCKDAIELVKPS